MYNVRRLDVSSRRGPIAPAAATAAIKRSDGPRSGTVLGALYDYRAFNGRDEAKRRYASVNVYRVDAAVR